MEAQKSGGKRAFPPASLFSLAPGVEEGDGAAALGKKRKRKAFDALVYWCATHQQAATQPFSLIEATNTLTAASVHTPSSLECDEAVLQWLQKCSGSLTCGQSLLVCSFVCEVLLCRLDAAAAEAAGGRRREEAEAGTDLLLQRQVNAFTNRIAALLQRANGSDKLESQPLSILASCAYGAHRLSCVESPFLGEAEKALLKIPPAVMFAILHQLRGDELRKLFQLEEQVAVNVCLTLLFIVDEERRQAFLPGGDTVIVNAILRRLLRHTALLLRKLDVTSEETLLSLANDVHSASHLPRPCGARAEVANSPSMQESAAIMQNIAFSSPTSRLEMLSYLLRIRRNPARYTRSELQLLPVLLQTVSNIRLAEARMLEAKIIAEVPLPDNDPVLVAQLFSFTSFKEARCLACLDAVATEHLSEEAAVHIIRCAGAHLRWGTLQRLTAVALGTERCSTSSSSSSPSLTSSLVLNDALECILMTLVTRLLSSTTSVERDVVQMYLAQLVERVDWAGSTPPDSAKLALERLTLFKKLSSCGFHIRAPEAVAALAEKALDLESGSSMTGTLQCVSEALPLLPEVGRRRSLVECMIRYNGTRSTSSVIRFVALLAPLALTHGVRNGELVQLLLKLQTLDPFKLRQGYIEGLPSGEDAYTVFVIHAVNYLLASEEWRTSTDRVREAVTLWIHDYLQHVMHLSRRQKLVGEAIPDDDKGEASPPHERDTEATVAAGPSPERLEEIFSALLRAGVKLPDFFASELTARVRIIEGAEALTGETRGKAHFPPPGHFVFCCKLDIAMDAPLSLELLEYLLATCDCRVLHFVITAFLVHAKATSREPRTLLLTNLRLVSQALRLFLHRINALGEDLSTAFSPSSVSSVVANTVRFLVGFLTKQERSQRVLKSLRGTHSAGEEEEEAVAAAAAAATDNREQLLAELAEVEKLLLRSLAHLSSAHTKDIGLLLLDRLTLLAPAAADYLMLQLQNQLDEFTQVELFYLARKYPPAQDVVMKELQKYDIALSVDLNDFLRVTRNLPMPVNRMVIEAHLPKLTFQWCTRLLSALALRHESVPLDLLVSMLARLEAEVENATVMDRNVALVVLQKYLNYEDAATEANAPPHRRRLVERCCDHLLVLEGIDSLDSLSSFLATFPDALVDVVGTAIAGRVVSAVLPELLADVDALLTLCRLLQKYKLLNDAVRLEITDGFFGKLLRAEGNAATSSPAAASYPLGNVLALALLLAESASQRAPLREKDGPGTDGVDHDHQAAARALQAVRVRYVSLADRLVIVSALVEQKDAVGLGQTQSRLAEEIAAELVAACDKMTSSEFSRLLQCISRLKYWHLVKQDRTHFGRVFQQTCRDADAHSRCVAFKALSSDVELFCHYEPLMMPLLCESVEVMSQEDMEMVLSAVLPLQLTEALESLLDAIGTRVLSMVDQCRRSTLIRVLQCHAAFGLQDDALVLRLLAVLEEQCTRETRLDTSQALTLLQATVDLDVPISSKLAVTCFGWLEHHVDGMTMTQLGHAARLAVEVEMGYTASVHAVAMRALEQREALRTNVAFRASVELLCDEFSVEIPWHMKPTVLRRRYQEERLKEYVNKRRAVVSDGLN
ncbi:uncharacterized protein Tco025E_07277 [Trypanosoma conorhini]|uniref:Uncharacterized protein n=1 Tax=Trypanosoma conorhini TaxID=83891 RepID=A0A3R7NKM2_9TRYP|nr:uncharacterized protein Tco025E_07277 [Trypanosoma conorhini]RNF07892.1 hypothetical protein Tco025E_07277 [Trypanosoma conorhini]